MHVIFDNCMAHLDAQLQFTMCSQAVGFDGNVLSSAIKCSAETFHTYSSTEGIMGWGCKAFFQIID